MLPTAPTGFNLSDINNNDNDIYASWTANPASQQILEYVVYINGSSWMVSPTNSATVNGLTNGTTYAVNVTSKNSRGESSFSITRNGAP
jgi:hypothetical protein